MHYRKFGSTGLVVSELAIGTGDNAGLFIKGSRSEQEEAVDLAIEAGINYFDTCPDHGHGIGEHNLGAALARHSRRPVIATLVEIYPESLLDLRAAVLGSLRASCGRLRVETIDIAMIHNPVQMSRSEAELSRHWMPVTLAEMLGPLREALLEAQDLGLIRFTGFAGERAVPEAARAVIASGVYDGVNVWYNVTNPSARLAFPCEAPRGHQYDGILDEIEAQRAGCAVIRPLAGGALSSAALDGPTPRRHPNAGGGFTRDPEAFQREVDAARWMDPVAKGLGLGVSELAYRFLLADRAVSTVIAGISDIGQLQETLKWVDNGPLAAEQVARIAAAAAAH